MRSALGVVAAVIGLGVVVFPQSRIGTPADEAAILKNRDAQNAAYNRHDAKAYAMLSAEDIDRIDATSTVVGRAGLERRYADSWKADSSGIVKDESRKIRFITSDVAILDVDNVITRSSGTTRNRATFVYAKRNGEWTSLAQRVIQKP